MDNNGLTERKMLSFSYGDCKIRFYPVYSSRRKTVEIAVAAPSEVIVTAPAGRTDEELITVVSRKARWITQKLFLMKDIRYQPVFRELVSGEALLYMGRNYRLDLRLDTEMKKPTIVLDHGVFRVKSRSAEQEYLRPHLIDWYRRKAAEKVETKIKYYAPKLGVEPAAFYIKDQKKRWGSCTKDGTLLFNWRCVLAPAPVLDYIAVHELCHLIERHHSTRFWSLLRAAMPGYEVKKQWLLENGVKLDV